MAGGPIGARCYADAVRTAAARLAAASDTPRLDAEILLAHVVPTTRTAVIAFPERPIDQRGAARFAELVERRENGEPLAYLVGEKEFRSLVLAVGPDVLVPRPETEHVVDAALARLDGLEAPAVLDLGTGSGAIALAVKHACRRAAVVGTDSSEAALAVASANGARLRLDVEWVRSDWFDSLGSRRFEAIISNPPYVASGDPHLSRLCHEPRAALDGGADGLDAIRAILRAAPRWLVPGGWLIVEHGAGQQSRIIEIALAAGFELDEAGRDLAGIDRFVVLRLPKKADASGGAGVA